MADLVCRRTNWREIADAPASIVLNLTYCRGGETIAEGVERGCLECQAAAALVVYHNAGGEARHSVMDERLVGIDPERLERVFRRGVELA